MAGFIFSISADVGIDGMINIMNDGCYAATVPKDLSTTAALIIASSVLADYCSMKTGDNVYFLCQRKLYGIGKLIDIGEDCKYKNYLHANQLKNQCEYSLAESKPLMGSDPNQRWICFFEPEKQYFKNGVDMDDVLLYKPASFKMLRAFQDRSFIKIDDQENSALKEYLYLKNMDSSETLSFDKANHQRIADNYNLNDYRISPNEAILDSMNEETNETSLEMLLEAGLIDQILKKDLKMTILIM